MWWDGGGGTGEELVGAAAELAPAGCTAVRCRQRVARRAQTPQLHRQPPQLTATAAGADVSLDYMRGVAKLGNDGDASHSLQAGQASRRTSGCVDEVPAPGGRMGGRVDGWPAPGGRASGVPAPGRAHELVEQDAVGAERAAAWQALPAAEADLCSPPRCRHTTHASHLQRLRTSGSGSTSSVWGSNRVGSSSPAICRSSTVGGEAGRGAQRAPEGCCARHHCLLHRRPAVPSSGSLRPACLDLHTPCTQATALQASPHPAQVP